MTHSGQNSKNCRAGNQTPGNKTDISLQSYKKKKNFCSKPYKKERKNYYKKWDMKNIKINNIDNKGNK